MVEAGRGGVAERSTGPAERSTGPWPQGGLVVAPSVLSADFARLADEVAAVRRAGADWIHLDVMDGHFVPNLTFGPPVVRALRRHSDAVLDVHLMIAPADPYLAAFAEAGADGLTVHVEAGPHLDRSLQAIRALGLRAGVALNPATPAEAIAWVLDRVDLVLVMTVNPGFGGQAFIAAMLPKVAQLKAMIGDRPIRLQVDGGVTPATIGAVVAAGADTVVAGSAVFAPSAQAESGEGAYRANLQALRQAAGGAA